ncbi:ATP-binding protein [uncultured Anaerococcus sp.]|uniref:sensor histidine kinase n=1 Tax=uncultured Anaerococcus sp. TaxID=293428 RepID=UPI0028894409|nr:ATP-binding protein [uncultured Anaerococcus sp.]
MKKLTKKSLITSATIASLLAVVVALYSKDYINIIIFYLASLVILIASHLYIDKKLDSYASKVSDFNKYYDFKDIGEDFEDVGQIYRNLLNKNVRLEKKVSMLTRKIDQLKTMTSNMEEGFIIFDSKGKVDMMNESAKTLLNKDENVHLENLVNKKEYLLAVKEVKLTSKSRSLSIDVNNYHLKLFIDPINEDRKMGFVVIVIDYSESRKAELMRREFSGNVTHELKSPLTSINGYAELIATGIAKDKDIREFAQIIYEEGNRLLEIIDDILKISRLDERDFELSKTQIDLKDEMDTIIKKFAQASDKRGIRVINRLDNFKIYSQKSLFVDLLSNIYENAIKYNKEGGEIEIYSILEASSIKVCIRDTGIGIANSDIKRVFERFYVVDKSRDRKVKSTGLGLSIVKHIADYLEMDISLESTLGEGSTFIININLE